jgi:hypothetical protein
MIKNFFKGNNNERKSTYLKRKVEDRKNMVFPPYLNKTLSSMFEGKEMKYKKERKKKS